MKRGGAHNLFRPSDVTKYPFFYIELSYAISTILGIGIYLFHAGSKLGVEIPEGASTAWQVAASTGGVFVLLLVAAVTAGIGLYGLFRGGFKWRAIHMFLQFLIRFYSAVGVVFVFGLWPTTWISSLLGAIVAGIAYLRLRYEQRNYENGY